MPFFTDGVIARLNSTGLNLTESKFFIAALIKAQSEGFSSLRYAIQWALFHHPLNLEAVAILSEFDVTKLNAFEHDIVAMAKVSQRLGMHFKYLSMMI